MSVVSGKVNVGCIISGHPDQNAKRECNRRLKIGTWLDTNQSQSRPPQPMHSRVGSLLLTGWMRHIIVGHSALLYRTGDITYNNPDNDRCGGRD